MTDRLAAIRARWDGVTLLILDDEGPLTFAPADVRYLLDVVDKQDVEIRAARRQCWKLAQRIEDLERRLYARPRYLGER